MAPSPPAEIPPALAALLDRRVTRRYRAEAMDDPLLDTVLAAGLARSAHGAHGVYRGRAAAAGLCGL